MLTVHIPHDFPLVDARAIRNSLCKRRIRTFPCHEGTHSFFILSKNKTRVQRYLNQWEAHGVHVLEDRPERKFERKKTLQKYYPQSFLSNQFQSIYNIAPKSPPKTCKVAIIELGGGYYPSDLSTYWKMMNLTTTPMVNSVSINGATNNPSPGTYNDSEVVLDIQVVGGICNSSIIDVYFAPNTTSGFYNAISTAVSKTNADQSPYYCAISISWGGPENTWTRSELLAYDELFAQAGNKNIVIFVATGDSGSNDSGGPCRFSRLLSTRGGSGGGTSLNATSTTYISETGWSSGGGGYSKFFPGPSYQSSLRLPARTGRAVPDVSADADPNTGVRIYLGGQTVVVGGTSMAAPLWAAAYCNSGCPPGLPATLYTLPSSHFHDITSGSNGTYQASTGYDVVTGLGTLNGLL